MGTYESKSGRRDQTIYVRVRADDAQRVAEILTENNFSVVAIHE
jgi:hypothetical protein